MRKNIIIRGLTVGTFTAALVGGVALASAGPASADTMDAAGQGFVGKGEVQSAFGWNNAKMQANQNGVTFTVKQNASQALSSSASQTATQEGSQSASQTGTKVYSQTATQDVTETLSCFKNGAERAARRPQRRAVGHGDRHGDRHSYRQP